MAGKTNIQWSQHSWNPLAGCSIVTPGCRLCYAMKLAPRLARMGQPLYAGLTKETKGGAVWTGEIRRAAESVLMAPLKRKKPTTYFVNSMSDLFHENVPDEWIDKIFAVMAIADQHTFQVLTKRAERMQDYCTRLRSTPKRFGMVLENGYLPNVWLGVSTERQKEADERIPLLLDTPAAVRFISAEPLLGPVDLTRLCIRPQKPGSIRAGIHLNAVAGRYCESGMPYFGDWDVRGPCPPASEQRRLDWVIVGGESGHGFRKMDPAWAEDILAQCKAAGTAVFMKQMSGRAPIPPLMQIRQFPETLTR